MIVIAPTSELTPDQITMFIHNLGIPITIKETCYGANIEGKRDDVRKVLAEVRKLRSEPHLFQDKGFSHR